MSLNVLVIWSFSCFFLRGSPEEARSWNSRNQPCDCGWNPWERHQCKSGNAHCIEITAWSPVFFFLSNSRVKISKSKFAWFQYKICRFCAFFLCLQTDFLMVVLRDVIHTFPDVRVILMSATIDTTMFREYFFNCPIIEVFGRTYPVQGMYLLKKYSFCLWVV